MAHGHARASRAGAVAVTIGPGATNALRRSSRPTPAPARPPGHVRRAGAPSARTRGASRGAEPDRGFRPVSRWADALKMALRSPARSSVPSLPDWLARPVTLSVD
jgi:hypothetical protein